MIPTQPDSDAVAIRKDLTAGDDGYRSAGKRFIKKRESFREEHGGWTRWLKEQGFSKATTHRYMEYAKRPTTETFVSFLLSKTYSGVNNSSDSEEWYTKPQYLESVRLVLGGD